MSDRETEGNGSERPRYGAWKTAVTMLQEATPPGDGPRERVVAATRRPLVRARRAGRVHDGVTAEDVPAVVAQLGRPLPGAGRRAADEMSPRLLRQYVDGLVVPAPRTARERERVPGR